MATLAHNLDSRRDSIIEAYPGMTVWWKGDDEHSARESDHNPDSRDIVHAIDAMTYTDTARGNEIVEWMLSDPADLEYVIFNRHQWTRSNGWREDDYDGDNPHEDHVHASGKHGSTGWASSTGTGYDTAAEAMTPEGMDMAYSEAQMQAFTWQYDGNGIGENDEDTHRSTLSYFNEILISVREIQRMLTAAADAIRGGLPMPECPEPEEEPEALDVPEEAAV